MIENPVLRGFHADPSIVRVGGDYYIATSTFEWYPGVQIHHSTDLVNWRLVARPLNRADLLDMRGNPDSCGVWAPCLSYADGRFWLTYTDVKRMDGAFKDAHNYVTSCATVDGDWSPRIYVTSSGFDASLFHDDDGRKWFLNMRWNHRGPGTGVNPANALFDGIECQEWSEMGGLLGEVRTIYTGTDRGLTEAPHLFKRNGWYYLTTAEGGTGYEHAVTLARSRSVLGPYETHPDKHLMTTKGVLAAPLQRTGHGQYVETPEGDAYHTYLCGRPVLGPRGLFCALGRETGLAKCVWRDEWLYLDGGGMVPPLTLPGPGPGPARLADVPVHRQFTTALPPEFQWLRTPEPDRIFRLTGHSLRLTGRESLGSWFEQALVARRQEHHAYTAATMVAASPPNWQRAAGLTTYYSRHKFHAALVTHDARQGRMLQIVSCLGDWPGEALTFGARVALPDGPVRLEVRVNGAEQQFLWAVDGPLQPLGAALDASVISDEGGRGEHASFTGAFVGMLAFDLTGQGWTADFTAFDYAPA